MEAIPVKFWKDTGSTKDELERAQKKKRKN